jgi:hypothetical protein
MKPTLLNILLTTCILSCAPFASGDESAKPLFYNIDIAVEPLLSKITVKAEIDHMSGSSFMLNKNMKIEHIFADGKEVDFHVNPVDLNTEAVEIVMETKIQDVMRIEYSGIVPDTIDDVNMVNANLVELASYSYWFPRFKDNSTFSFQLSADLPKEFIPLTNGIPVSQKKGKSRNITVWESLNPDFDIAFVAAPDLNKLEATQNKTSVEIYCYRLPKDYVKSMADDLLKARQILENFYGEPAIKGNATVLYSPRDGWGYVRSTFIVVGENRSLGQYRDKFGKAMDFRYIIHEISHFWWGIADSSTPDDWINEGLADFSAFRVFEIMCGKEFADKLIDGYKQRASSSRTDTPIAETKSDSPDREVNRYDKPALMFIEAQKKFGSDKMDQLFRSLYSRFRGTRDATTALFLAEAEKQIGPEAKEFFSKTLYAKRLSDLN